MMGLFSNLSQFWGVTSKYLQVQHSSHSLPDYTPNDFRNLANEAFGRNDLIHTALTIRANSFIEADLSIQTHDDELLVGDPRLAVFLSPNNYQSGKEFMRMVVHHLDIDGNAFILKGKSGKGRPQELHLLRPDRVVIITSNEPGELIQQYIYNIDGNKIPIPVEDMLHIKTANPYSPWRGLSVLQPLLKHIDIDNEARDFTKSLLENQAAPGGFLKIMGAVTKDAKRRLTESFKQRFGGDNRGTVGVLDADVEFIQTSMNMNELNFSHITEFTESRILSALGINPVILGVSAGQSGSTFNNVAEAKLSFYQQTIIPLQTLVADAITKDPDLNKANDIQFLFDVSDVSALSPVREQRVTILDEAYKSGWVTINEVRTEAGLPPVDGGDDLRVLQEPEPTQAAPKVDNDTQDLEDRLDSQDNKATQVSAKKSQLDIETEWAEAVRKTADKGFQQTAAWTALLFESMFEDIAEAIDVAEKDGKVERQLAKLEKELNKLQDKWRTKINQASGAPLADIAKEVLQGQETGVGISFRLTAEQVDTAVAEYSFKFADRISTTAAEKVRNIFKTARAEQMSLSQIRQVLSEEFTGRVSKQWVNMVARTETIRAANEGTLAGYKASGVTTVRWVAAGDSCAYCQGLDGQTAVTGESFVNGPYQPEGAKSPLNLSYSGGQLPIPPAHPHCRCTIIEETQGL